MLGLGVKVHADTSELDRAESRIARFGEHFEHHFMRHFSRLAGSTALAVGAVKLIESIFGRPEEIEKLALKYGLITDEVQYLEKAFKDMGLTFEEGMEKAKTGAIDLLKLMQELREKGTRIIAAEDVAMLAEDTKTVKGWGNTLVDIVVTHAAFVQRALKTVWQVMKAPPAVPGSAAYNNEKGNPVGYDESGPIYKEDQTSDDFDFHNLPPMLGVSTFFQNQRRQKEIKAEIARLRGQKRDMRENEIIGGQLTDRQSVGAYSSQTGAVVSKISEVKDVLDGIDTKIEELKTQLEQLK